MIKWKSSKYKKMFLPNLITEAGRGHASGGVDAVSSEGQIHNIFQGDFLKSEKKSKKSKKNT